MTNDELRTKLFSLSDDGYREFTKKLIPNTENIIGVRSANLKSLAKEIVAGDYMAFLQQPYNDYHEEVLVWGLVLGLLKIDLTELLKQVDKWSYYVNNWAICDSGICAIKLLGKQMYRKEVWQYLNTLIDSEEIYRQRLGIVAMFRFFNDDEYATAMSQAIMRAKSDDYYVKMAKSWGLCEVLIKHYEIGLGVIKSHIDMWIKNKAIQKSCESYRLTCEQKLQLKSLKQKL